MKSYYLTKLIVLLLALPIFGQGSFIIDNYSYQDYKSHRQNWAITQDTNGVLFFGSNDALIRYDGVAWAGIHISNNTQIRSLHTAKNGKVYYGNIGDFGELKVDKRGRIVHKSFLDQIENEFHNFNDIYRIQENSYGVYFQSYEYIFLLKDDQIRIIDADSTFSQLSKIGDRLFVRLKNDGLYEVIKDTLSRLNRAEYFSRRMFFSAEKIGSEDLIATQDSGLISYSDTGFTAIDNKLSNYLSDNQLYRTEQIDTNEIAFGTLGGGIVLSEDDFLDFSIIRRNQGLTDDIIYELYLDSEGLLWVATDNGISKILINNSLKTMNALQNLRGNITHFEKIDEDIYVKSTNALYRWNSTTNDIYEYKFGYPLSIVSDGKEIVFSTELGLINVVKNDTSILNSDLFFREMQSYLFDDQVFIAGINGTVVQFLELEKGRVETISTFRTQYNLIGVTLHDDFIWVISQWGEVLQFNLKGDQIGRHKISLSGSNQLRYISSYRGELKVGSDVGLFTFREDEFQKDSLINDKFPVGEENTQQFFRFVECEENLWISYNRKIAKYDGESISFVPYQLIGAEEEINVIKCFDGEIWFGGNAGIYILEETDWDYHSDFKTNITGIYVHSDSLIYGGFGEPLNPIVLPYEDNEMRFTYAAASYVDETRNTYSYKLEGFDDNWSPWSLETQRDYTNLPEGDYVFKVRSRNVYEVDGKMDQLSFSILPPWYRTWWSYFMYTILIAGMLYTTFKIRVNQILKMERLRTRIASDLHDEVSATLTGITYFATAAQRDKDPKKRSYFVNLITESAGDAKEKITDIVWAINPENDQWDEFLVKCRRYASDLMESKEIEYTLHIADQIPGKLKMDVRQHLWMIFKEMLTNVVRHSQAERVDVILDVEHGVLKLIVQDNGNGFKEGKKTGNGLLNIRKRAEKIKGKLQLETDKEFGTRWRLELPL